MVPEAGAVTPTVRDRTSSTTGGLPHLGDVTVAGGDGDLHLGGEGGETEGEDHVGSGFTHTVGEGAGVAIPRGS